MRGVGVTVMDDVEVAKGYKLSPVRFHQGLNRLAGYSF